MTSSSRLDVWSQGVMVRIAAKAFRLFLTAFDNVFIGSATQVMLRQQPS